MVNFYLLTYACMASRWPEAIPLKNIAAKVVAERLVQIFSRAGLPHTLLSDQGQQFTGKLAKQLAQVFAFPLVIPRTCALSATHHTWHILYNNRVILIL